ncbi:MAG TPA: DEAD/DEAH box helicase, partial [Chitinophagaceae bacterium]|nr:DEAD/DEAH box helicase [Chitinophagaceae bacterium]
MSTFSNILSSPIEYLKGVGPQKAELLKKELGLFTFGDLLEFFPYRHIDKTKVNLIADLQPQTEFIQLAGVLVSVEVIGQGRGKRLVAHLRDRSGNIELTWFQSIPWVQRSLHTGETYLVYGRVSFFQGKPQIVHPEFEVLAPDKKEARPDGPRLNDSVGQAVGQVKNFLEPVYPSTEKLKSKWLGGRQIGKLTQALMAQVQEKDVRENLPGAILTQLKLPGRFEAFNKIHFPGSQAAFDEAVQRFKFEELFVAQLRMQMLRSNRHRYSKGFIFEKVGDRFNTFYKEGLPFELTNAQKRVIREIRADTGKGKQMNRLLQGDVGSGKTIVAVLTMLLAIDNGYQACLMAPTEILAQQHFKTISGLLDKIDVPVKLLTGSTKGAARKKILEELAQDELPVLVGTHAVIEDAVQFKNLGIIIIDEQHRFG